MAGNTVAGPMLPSDATIAFAVSVVGSKPDDSLDIQEYIRLLRQHIARGRRENALSAVYQHLDRSAYYRAESERFQVLLLFEKEENDKLRLELSRAQAETARPSSPTKKRKQDATFSSRDTKNPKYETPPAQLATLSLEDLAAEFDPAGEAGSELLRGVFRISAMVKGRNDAFKSDDLAYYLIRASTSISQVVRNGIDLFASSNYSESSQLQTAVIAAGRAVAILFSGVNKLSNAADATHVLGRVTYALVKMFQSLLSNIELLSRLEVERANYTAKKAPAPKNKPNSKSKECSSLVLITNFLCSILDNLNPRSDPHKPLFEGFAFCTLDRLGAQLYAAQFGHAREPTLREEIQRNLPTDDGNHPDASGETIAVDSPEQKQLKIEATYLIHLLKRITGSALHFMGGQLTKKGTVKIPTNKSPAKDLLSLTARDCLQQTLVMSIFGPEARSEEFLSRERLKFPLAPEGQLAMPKASDTDVNKWFIEEAWRLLGWEILAKGDDEL